MSSRTFHGVDVSVAQQRIDHHKLVRTLNLDFAIVKGGEGNEGHVDKNFRVNIAGFKSTGVAVGVYMVPWLLPITGQKHRDPLTQIQAFWEASDGVGTCEGELPPMLDFEWPDTNEWDKWKCDRKQILDCMEMCCYETERLWQRTPMVYVFPRWWQSVALGGPHDWIERYPLWLANYQNEATYEFPETFKPVALTPWGKNGHTLLQWSGNNGVPVPGQGVIDRNVFKGTEDDFLRLCKRDPAARLRSEIQASRDAVRADNLNIIVDGVRKSRDEK